MVFNQIRRLYITLDATDKATRKLKRVDAAADATSMSMAASARRAERLRSRLVAVGFAATIVTSAIGAMVFQVAQTERVFARIRGTMAATASEMEAIRSEALQLGKDLPVTINEAAMAFEQLAFAGLNAEESVKSANAVVNLAVAGGISMAQAAKTAGRAMNAFGLEAAEMGQVTNTMAATFSNSALNLNELTKAMEYAQSVAKIADQSITELSAALGTLADNGLAASRAGTSLERMFIELSKQSSSTMEGLRMMNVEMEQLTNQEGNFRDLNEIIQTLAESTQNMTGVERIRALQQTFGARGARSAALLIESTDAFIEKIGDNARAQIKATMNTLSDMTDQQREMASATLGFEVSGDMGTAEMIRRLRELDGTTQEVAATIDTAFAGIGSQSAQILARDLENTGVSAEALAEDIQSMTAAADIAESQMNSLWGQIEQLQGSLSTIMHIMVAGMKPALDVVYAGAKGLFDLLIDFPNVLRGIGLGLAMLSVALIGLTGYYAVAIARTKIFQAMLMDTAGAHALNVAWIKLHEAAILTLQGNYWMALGALVGYNTAQTISAELTAWNIIVTEGYTIATLQRMAAESGSTAMTYAKAAAEGVATVATYAYAAAQWALNNALTLGLASIGLVVSVVAQVGPVARIAAGGTLVLAAAVYVLYNVASLGLVNIVYALIAALAGLAAVIKGLIDMDIGNMLPDFSVIIEPMVAAVDALVFSLRWLYALFVQVIELGMEGYLMALSTAFDWAVQRVQDFAYWMSNLPIVGTMVVMTVQFVTDVLNSFTGAAEDAGGIVAWFAQKWDALGMAIGDGIRAILPYIAVLVGWWNQFTAVVNDVVGAVATMIEDGLAWLRDETIALGNAIQSRLEPYIDSIQDTFRALGAVIATYVTPYIEAAREVINDIAQEINSFLAPIIDRVNDAFAVFNEYVVMVEQRLEAIHPILGEVSGVLAPIIVAVGAVGLAFKTAGEVIYDTVMGIVTAIPGLVTDLTESITGAFEAFVSWFTDEFPIISFMVGDIISDIVDYGEGLVDTVMWWAGAIGNAVDDILGFFGDLGSELYSELIEPFVNGLGVIAETFYNAIVVELQKIAERFSFITDPIMDGVNMIIDGFNRLKAVVGDLVDRFGWLKVVVAAITAPLWAIPAAIYLIVTRFDQLAEMVTGAVTDAIEYIAGRFPFAADMITELADRISQAMDIAIPVLVEFGEILASFVGPILSFFGDVLMGLGKLVLGFVVGVFGALVGILWVLFKVVEAVINVIIWFIDVLQPLWKAIGMVVVALVKAVGAILMVVAALGGALLGVVVDAAAAIVGTLVWGLTVLVGVLTHVAKVIIDVVAWAITDLLIPIFNALVGVIDFVIGVIGALVIGFYELFKLAAQVGWEIGKFIGTAQSLGDTIKNLAGLIWDAFIGALEGIYNLLPQSLQNIIDGVYQWATQDVPAFFAKAGRQLIWAFAGGIGAIPGVLVDAFVSTIASIIPFMPSSDAEQGPLSNLTDAGMAIIETIASGILALPMMIANALMGVLGSALGAAADVVGGAIDIGKDIVGGIVDGIKSAPGAVFNAVKGAVKDPVGTVANIATGAVSLGEDIAKGIGDGIKGATNFVANALQGIPVIGPAAGLANQAINSAVNLGQDVAGGIADGIRGGINMVEGAVDTVTGAAQGAVSMGADAFNAGAGMMSDFGSGIASAGGDAVDAVGDAAGTVRDHLPFSPAKEGPLSTIAGMGEGLMSVLADGIESAKGMVQGSVNTVAGLVKDGLAATGGLTNQALSMGQEIASGIAGGMHAGKDAVAGAAQDAIGAAQDVLGSVGQMGSNLLSGAGDAIGAVQNAGSGIVGNVGQTMNAAGGMASDVGGAISGVGGGVANSIGLTGGQTVNDVTEDISINFQGEVHDAQKVEDMVSDAVVEGKEEAVGTVEDTLDMGSDAIDAAGDFLGGG